MIQRVGNPFEQGLAVSGCCSGDCFKLNQLLILEANISKHASVFRASTLFNPPVNLRPDYQVFRIVFRSFYVRLEGPILSFIMEVATMQ